MKKSTADTLTASQARSNIYQLIDEVAHSHHPKIITGKRNNAVLISESDWKAIQETLYLQSIPGMAQSIKDGLKEPFETCSDKLPW